MDPRAIVKLLEEDHEETVKKLAQIGEELEGLHEEGKGSRKLLLKKIRAILSDFSREMGDHLDLEEQALFPFLEIHVPKLKPAIRFLLLEHDDFRKNLDILRFLLRDLSRQRNDLDRLKVVDSIKQTGTYLAYLLRHHMEAEERSIYEVIRRELHPEEMERLEQVIRSAKKGSFESAVTGFSK